MDPKLTTMRTAGLFILAASLALSAGYPTSLKRGMVLVIWQYLWITELLWDIFVTNKLCDKFITPIIICQSNETGNLSWSPIHINPPDSIEVVLYDCNMRKNANLFSQSILIQTTLIILCIIIWISMNVLM